MCSAQIHRFFGSLLLCLTWTVGLTQELPPPGTRLTTTTGLPHNTIAGVEQDRAGFIWIATHDGLARYDGRTVKVFRNRPGDSTSLADNKIIQFEQTPSGSFLIVTGSSNFQLFDPHTERFTTLLEETFLIRRKMLVTQGQLSVDGRHLWGLMQGIRLIDYDRYRKKIRVYDVPKLVGSANQMHDFILSRTGYIYGECLTGLFQFNPRTGRKRLVPFPFRVPTRTQDQNFWSGNRHRIIEGPDGQIAVFGYSVVALYDPARNHFHTIPIPDGVIPTKTDSITSGAQVQNRIIVYALKTLADNRLYLGYMNRVYRLDHDRLTLLRQPGPPVNWATPWLLDHSGVLWTSGELAGLTRLNLHALPFEFFPKRKSFSEDLLEQDLGVTLPDSFEVWPKPRWPRYTAGPNKTGYLIDPSRVYRYTQTSRSIHELTGLRVTKGQVGYKLCLKLSRQGRVWFYSNYRGLVEADPTSRAGFLYPNSQLPILRAKPGYDAGDIQPMGRSVWVGSQYGLGLFRYDIVRQRFDQPLINNPQSANSLPGNTINCLAIDPSDSTLLWIGTEGGGLCRLATHTMTFRRLGEAEGFPNSSIQSIEVDNRGMLWCATNQGLVRLNPATLTWRYFTIDDGLADNAFLPTSSARLPDGRLVFGTPSGRIIFDPKAIQDVNYEPPVVFTSLQINNQPADATSFVNTQDRQFALPAPLNTLVELVLDHTQNFLTIGFAGLDYGRTGKVMYRYKLGGVDADWVLSGRQNTANYTQLAPGRYLFSVNSTTADGRWSHRIKRLSIIITPPFWATWWAYLLYVLAFGGLVLGFIRFRIRQARQQQEIVLKRREAEQLRAVDEVKTRFFSNITHEFRTPLTLILSPTEKLLRQTRHDEPTRQTLLSIRQNADQLLRLINQLLDLSKLEGSSMGLSLVRGNAVAFVQQLAEPFQPLATSRQIALYVTSAGGAGNNGPWLFDADKWGKIIANLLSNALKFTPSGGQVSLTIGPPNTDQLVLTLTDTGIGISADSLPHIFDRFYQVDTSQTRAYEGTGIGLALVKELTDLLGGTITVESRTATPGGTTFTLTLPLLPVSAQPDAPSIDWLHTPAVPAEFDLAPSAPMPLLAVPIADDAPLVLVVDDNDELRTFIAGELASRYRVLTAADGEAGWAICQRDLPDVVISDVMMPRMDGLQLTHCIKSTLVTNHIAVVLLTARAAHESRMAGLEQGADDYLTKPFHVDELFLRLGNMLTRLANLRTHLHRQLSAPITETDEPVIDPFVNQLHQAIDARLDDVTLGVDDLALAAGVSRRTLNRKLSTTANMSASDFIRHHRLQRATQLLRDGCSVTETAYSVGFDSPAYFATVFKQTYLQTPSEFLSKLRG